MGIACSTSRNIACKKSKGRRLRLTLFAWQAAEGMLSVHSSFFFPMFILRCWILATSPTFHVAFPCYFSVLLSNSTHFPFSVAPFSSEMFAAVSAQGGICPADISDSASIFCPFSLNTLPLLLNLSPSPCLWNLYILWCQEIHCQKLSLKFSEIALPPW